MKFLTFRAGEARFEERSAFAVSAACVVANAMREALAHAFGVAVELRLFEPLVPTAQAWSAITNGARCYRMSGSLTDAAIVVRSLDAVALAGAAFGEYGAVPSRDLSSLESAVLERIVRAASRACAPACGMPCAEVHAVERIEGFSTYFDVQIERPFAARIGIALARDPQPAVSQSIAADDLLDLDVECTVTTDGVTLPAYQLATLELGSIVPITEQTGVLTAVLTLAGRPVARGECGVRGNRLALAIRLSPTAEGSAEPES